MWAECVWALGPAPMRTPAAGLQGRTRAPRPGQEDGGERAGAEAGAALQAGDRHRAGHPAAAGPGGVELQRPGGGRAGRGAPTAVRAGRPGAGARGVLAGLRAAPARQVGHGPRACGAQAASWSPTSVPPTLLSQAGLAGCVREQCVTRRPGRLVDWGPRREERVIVGWSPSRGAMKVRRGDRGWEERLGPSLLEGGKPQAKLSKVGRGRGCTRRGRRSGGRGTPGIYVQLRLRSSEWRRSGTRGGIMACDKVYMPGNKSERE